MVTRSYTKYGVDRFGRSYLSNELHYDYDVSPRSPLTDSLLLRSNRCSLFRRDILAPWVTPNSRGGPGLATVPQPTYDFLLSSLWASAQNEAVAKFNGKLRKGSASLGVTIATWRQSSDMIVNRLGTVSRGLDKVASTLSRDKKRLKWLRRQANPLANDILELEFGWLPLFSDIRSSLTTVCGPNAVPPCWVTGRSRQKLNVSHKDGMDPKQYTICTGRYGVTYSARVLVSNPNLWLLNRAGLINLPAVAWDLVPWSFVVNFFSNTNQMISSLTNEVGLDIRDRSYTRSSLLYYERRMVAYDESQSGANWITRYRSRTLGSSPPLTWQFRVPDFSWETAIIAASLVTQKISKINKLIRF